MLRFKNCSQYLQLMLSIFIIFALSSNAFAASDKSKEHRFSRGGRIGEAQDHIIVKYKKTISPMAKDKILFKHRLREKRELRNLGINIVSISSDDDPQEVADRLNAQEGDNIEFAEVDALIAPDVIPNDPNFSSQWHVTKIQAPTAWDTTKGNGVIVAVLDTGTNCAHPDLATVCLSGWNIIDNSSDSSDINGHGTLTAGTVAEAGDNAIGSAGIAYQAKIMPIRVTNDPAGYAYYSSIANAVIYAADHGAKIATNSYQTSDSLSVQSAANYLRSKGGIFIASAGNSGALLAGEEIPSVITVAATDSNDHRASWSNYGAQIDVSAPGVSVYTTNKNGNYSYASGTSFSAPSTAGVFALLFAANPNLTPAQAENILKTTADDIGDAGWDQYYGWGRINAAAAVTMAKNMSGNLDTTPPSVPTHLVVSSLSSASVQLAWTASTDLVGVAGYKIFRDDFQVGTSTSISYSDKSVVAGTTYHYTVKAFDEAGNVSGASNTVTAVIPQEQQVVSIVSYSVMQKTTNSATIVWTTNIPSTGVVSYGVRSKRHTSFNLSATDSVLATSHEVTLTNLSRSTGYSYRITVVSEDGNSSASTSSTNFRTSKR